LPEWTAAGAAVSPDPLAPLLPIMQAAGVTLDPAAFHTAVNSVFHTCGAPCYDKLHSDMWESLPQQLQLLVSDFLGQYPPPNPRMSALDLGCGTGLATELILQSRMGAFIRQVDLADPSQEMLDIAGMRESILAVRHRLVRATIHQLPVRARYDVIVACYVLQHVPDLPEFLRQVSLRQQPGAVFLHLHDANLDYRDDPEQIDRVERVRSSGQARAARLFRRLGRSATTELSRVTDELLRRKIIDRTLTKAEIRGVVDLCVHQPRAISIRQMKTLLPEYELVSCRSYAFFGVLVSALSPRYRTQERALIAARAPNGSRIAAVWRKKEHA
jgi:2-polyprenyl-3-methyl-5-hydroxy-6-metoxy-1,4-benzoquinol methylase